MAEKACHGFGSTTQVGLTQVLDRVEEIGMTMKRTALIAASLIALSSCRDATNTNASNNQANQEATDQVLANVPVSAPAIQTGWLPIVSLDDRTVYGDLAAATRHGGEVKIWTLIDHQTIQSEAGDSYLSSKGQWRSEEHTSELQSLMRISYAVFCLKKKNKTNNPTQYIARVVNIQYTHY